MDLDQERCYRAVASRDARFDGAFFTAVRTTGIYCRPSCPAITPKRGNVTFFRTPAAAQRDGYRACRRCRPDAVPGSPEWNVRQDVVGRVMRMIGDGAVERLGVAGVAAALGYSERHLNRIVTAELGAGVLAIARTQRAHVARLLLETTSMRASDVAWTAGFGSIRSFNDTIQAVYGEPPTAVRERAAVGAGRRAELGPGAALSARRTTSRGATVDRAPTADPGGGIGPVPLTVRLATRQPLDAAGVLGFLGQRAVPGLEHWDGSTYRRTMSLPHGHAAVACRAGDGGVTAEFRLADVRDLAPAVSRVRRMLDLDADPAAVAEVLGADPLLAPGVSRRPGLRVAGCIDPHEVVVRAIVGQQVSVAGARTIVGRLVEAHGEPLSFEDPALDRVFPTMARLAETDPERLSMPRARGAALGGVCAALADGSVVLDAGADRAASLAALQRFPGIGPWTTAYVAMRGMGDPDVMLAGDLGVRRAIEARGGDGRARAIEARAHAWRPWRSYAVAHLWASLDDPPTPAAGRGPGAAPAEPDQTAEPARNAELGQTAEPARNAELGQTADPAQTAERSPR